MFLWFYAQYGTASGVIGIIDVFLKQVYLCNALKNIDYSIKSQKNNVAQTYRLVQDICPSTNTHT